MGEPFEIIGKTLAGLEQVLAEELAALGATSIKPGVRLVSFRGDLRLLYSANLWCRTAIRFLKPIKSFHAATEHELYRGIGSIDWHSYLDVDGSLAIDPVVHSSFCTHSLFAAQLAKDAIVDQFRDRFGKRPSVDLKNPALRLNLHINQNRVTIHLDSSGESLHKRGYRMEASEAPINEVLAAGILALTEWDRTVPLVDPMCGSGTFVIEAARWARNIAPGILRSFAFERWKDYDRALHSEVDKQARVAIRPAAGVEIVGSDHAESAIEVARENASHAAVAADVQFDVRDFAEICPPPPPGIVVANPPYDERMKVAAIAKLYRRLGDAFKQRFGGYTAFMFTGNLDAAKTVGLRTARRVTLFNGPIECRLLRYEIRGRVPAGVSASSTEASSNIQASEITSRVEPIAAACTAAATDSSRVREQLEMFGNRLRRMSRHWKKWARRQGITCFRVYDRDIPDVPLSIDLYGDRLHIAEFERPHIRTESEHDAWLRSVVETARSVLDVPADRVYFKQHRRQRGAWQYSRHDERDEWFEVSEGGHRFIVNLAEYFDTGLFLDHRITRSMVQAESAGKRFLNLFAYTGSFTVYAAAGGAASTSTVDLSHTYLDWAGRNMCLNGFAGLEHQYYCDDTLNFLRTTARSQPPYDLAVVDPPTFSNSKGLDDDFDVERDHARLLDLVRAVMVPGGRIFFSTNRRKFHLGEDRLRGVSIRDLTGQTIPLDFQRKRSHRCWLLTRTEP